MNCVGPAHLRALREYSGGATPSSRSSWLEMKPEPDEGVASPAVHRTLLPANRREQFLIRVLGLVAFIHRSGESDRFSHQCFISDDQRLTFRTKRTHDHHSRRSSL